MVTQASEPRPLSWGILGASRIARSALVPAIRLQGGTVAAIGASTRERAEAFAGPLQIPLALEGYKAIVEHDEIEAVYIPLANGDHFQWALACARAGKHCLCEKPLVLRPDEAAALREAFASAGCRIMEAFMWRHHPQVRRVEEWLRSGEIGEVRRMHAEFSFTLDRPDDYRWLEAQGGGAIWDLGVYCVNSMRLFYGDEPQVVSARRMPHAPGSCVDCSTAAWLDFGGHRLGTFQCSFTSFYRQFLDIIGTRGRIRMSRPFAGAGRPTRIEMFVGEQQSVQDYDALDAYAEMVAHFTRAARDPSFALLPGEDGVAQAHAMAALHESANEQGMPQKLVRR